MQSLGIPAGGLAVLLIGLVSPALACPVCGFGRDGTTSAYLLTAVLMSLVPLLMAGAIVYYLLRQGAYARGGPRPRPHNAVETPTRE